jgi:DNA polymerase phi
MKESSSGTRDVFDVDDNADQTLDDVDSGQQNGDSSSASAADSELLDSDVEQVSERSSSPEEQAGEGSDEDPAELEAFDAKLAAALGTCKGQDDIDAEDSEGSDEDMYEEDMDQAEMAALDEKLAEVFRARKPQAGKKKERKEMKEAIVNLKRRVLDLMDVYLKQEYLNPLALDLVLPLITTARTTGIKQISNRAHEILQAFCSKCKGKDVLVIDADDDDAADEVLDCLMAVHKEAGLDDFRAHGIACSRASILLVKILVKAQIDVGKLVDIYAETRKKQLLEPNCKVPPLFFTEWNNWCVSARDQLAG